MFDNNLRQIKVILYRLKRNFGKAITIKSTLSLSHNLQTGATTHSTRSIEVKRAIVLPTRIVRSYIYDLSFVAANKNFTYGALFDKDTRYFIIDAKDLPTGFTVSEDDQIVYGGQVYIMKAIEHTADNRGYIIGAVNTKDMADE